MAVFVSSVIHWGLPFVLGGTRGNWDSILPVFCVSHSTLCRVGLRVVVLWIRPGCRDFLARARHASLGVETQPLRCPPFPAASLFWQGCMYLTLYITTGSSHSSKNYWATFRLSFGVAITSQPFLSTC
jgi:hypothetical protein